MIWLEIGSRTHKYWGRLSQLLMKRTARATTPETTEMPKTDTEAREIPREPEDDWDDDDDE